MRGRDMIPPFPPFPHTFKAGPKTLELLCPDTPVPAPLSHTRRLTRPVALWPYFHVAGPLLACAAAGISGERNGPCCHRDASAPQPQGSQDRQLRRESGCGKLRHDTPHRRRREHGTEVQLHVPPLNTAQHPGSCLLGYMYHPLRLPCGAQVTSARGAPRRASRSSGCGCASRRCTPSGRAARSWRPGGGHTRPRRP